MSVWKAATACNGDFQFLLVLKLFLESLCIACMPQVNPLVGFLASEIVDSQLLEAFAHDQEIDSRVLDGLNRELAGNSTEPKDLCRSEEARIGCNEVNQGKA